MDGVGIWLFPFGIPYFQGLYFLVSGRVTPNGHSLFQRNFPTHRVKQNSENPHLQWYFFNESPPEQINLTKKQNTPGPSEIGVPFRDGRERVPSIPRVETPPIGGCWHNHANTTKKKHLPKSLFDTEKNLCSCNSLSSPAQKKNHTTTTTCRLMCNGFILGWVVSTGAAASSLRRFQNFHGMGFLGSIFA